MESKSSYKEKLYPGQAKIIVPGDIEQSLEFCLDHLLTHLNEAIAKKGKFTCALSGGSTPLKLFKLLAARAPLLDIQWEKVYFFWGDERFVPEGSDQNNYTQAMNAGLNLLPIPKSNIFPIQTVTTPSQEAKAYEQILLKELSSGSFDYIMLGLGEDGHTASLFPETEALSVSGKWVSENYVPKLEQHRITLTLDCLNQAKSVCFYVFGATKTQIINTIFKGEFKANCTYPATMLKLQNNEPIWICDKDAAQELSI